jgi:hypothetical protein
MNSVQRFSVLPREGLHGQVQKAADADGSAPPKKPLKALGTSCGGVGGGVGAGVGSAGGGSTLASGVGRLGAGRLGAGRLGSGAFSAFGRAAVQQSLPCLVLCGASGLQRRHSLPAAPGNWTTTSRGCKAGGQSMCMGWE